MKLLMLGNSFCYYFVEELFGMADSVGIHIKVCNLYKSGCYLSEHWNWLQEKNPRYHYITTDENGRNVKKAATINEALVAEDWDVITLQQHFNPGVASDEKEALDSCYPYAANLFEHLRTNHPKAKLYFQHTWAYQVGYLGPYTEANVANNFSNVSLENKVLSKEKQALNHEVIRKTCLEVCRREQVDRIPSGDAWKYAREDARVGDVLCARLGKGKDNEGDFYHDGDIGGGQYLNACVWFEVLTRKSCLGNEWRPPYELAEEKILALQEAAHRAVAECYGADYCRE